MCSRTNYNPKVNYLIVKLCEIPALNGLIYNSPRIQNVQIF